MQHSSDEMLPELSLEKTQSPFERLALKKGIAIDTSDIEDSWLQSIKMLMCGSLRSSETVSNSLCSLKSNSSQSVVAQ